ncbi:rho-associated protein kinase 1 [Patella vulgata]|uniref:rho-associated protein kinase 1 n=1 Tax=Patella vulgata TaxID=6465 RepID=UPI0024A93F6E|nr:rho-associated protein kinase 1 [Patella vulgata]
MAMYQVKQKGRMPEDDYVRVRDNYCYLVEQIKEPVKLSNKLFEKNIFDADEKEEIQKIFRNAEKGRDAAADKLLMYVLNSGDAYGKFILCLRELGYKKIVNVLENTTNGKNKTNLMTEQDKTRHQLEDLHKDHDLAKQELENLKKQMETQDGDSKQMLKKIEKLETYKKQTEEKEALTKKRFDELETCIKTLTLNEEDTVRQQLLHGTLSGNTSDTSDKKGKNKTNLMTEQDTTRHQLEDLHKDHDLAKQELENLKKQVETLKTRQDGDSKQMLKKIEKREHELETYKKQTEEKEALTKKRFDELETCIKTLTLNEEDTVRQQLLHGTLSGNTSDTSDKKGKNKTNLMTEQDTTRHQLEDLHKDRDLAKQELENLKKQMETQDGDSKQMLKKIEKLETYKKQTEEKEALTKKRIDELETCIKTLTLNEEGRLILLRHTHIVTNYYVIYPSSLKSEDV